MGIYSVYLKEKCGPLTIYILHFKDMGDGCSGSKQCLYLPFNLDLCARGQSTSCSRRRRARMPSQKRVITPYDTTMFMPFIAVMGPWTMADGQRHRRASVPASWLAKTRHARQLIAIITRALPVARISRRAAKKQQQDPRIASLPCSVFPSSAARGQSSFVPSCHSCSPITVCLSCKFPRPPSKVCAFPFRFQRTAAARPTLRAQRLGQNLEVFNPSRRRHVENEHLHVEQQQQVSRNSNYVVVFAVVKTHTQILLYS